MDKGFERTAETFRWVGIACFGQMWIGAMAHALATNVRTIDRWAKGQQQIPNTVWRDLATILRDRARAQIMWADNIEKSNKT